jgi:hypothetical protein
MIEARQEYNDLMDVKTGTGAYYHSHQLSGGAYYHSHQLSGGAYYQAHQLSGGAYYQAHQLSGGAPKRKPKSVVDMRGKQPVFKSINLYIGFSNFVYNVFNNLKKVNKYFTDIIRSINYVEPDTMDEYDDAVNSFNEVYRDFKLVSFYRGSFNTRLSTGLNDVEKLQLINKIRDMQEQIDKLDVMYNFLSKNYNFTTKQKVKKATTSSLRSYVPLERGALRSSAPVAISRKTGYKIQLYDEDDDKR